MSDENETVGTLNEERIRRLNAIADNADERRHDEFDDVDGETVYPREPRQQAQEEQQEDPHQDDIEPPAPPRMVRVKVNGREMEVSEEEVIRRAQKNWAADEYLQRAAEAARKANELAVPPLDRSVADDDAVQIARAIQLGTEEDAVQAIRNLRSQPPAQSDAVARIVDERLSFTRAVENFEREYEDIRADPMLWKLAGQRDDELARERPDLPVSERFRTVGDEIRQWKAQFATPQRIDKAARKASVAAVPTAAGRQAPLDDEPDDNPETVIAQLAKARGQGAPIKKQY